MGVEVAAGVEVATGVEVEVGVAVGPNNCPDPQLNITKLKNKTNTMAVRFEVFISSPALSRAYPAAAQASRITFMMAF